MGKESLLQSACIDLLKEKKIYYINIHGGGFTAKGAPDVVACVNGHFVAFEFKVGDNDMQPDQRIHRKRLMQSGGRHYCPRSLHEFTKILEQEIRDGT